MFLFAVLFIVYAFLCGPEFGLGIFLSHVIPNYTVKHTFIIYKGYLAIMLIFFFASIVLDFYQK